MVWTHLSVFLCLSCCVHLIQAGRYRPDNDDGTYSKKEEKDFDKYFTMIDLDNDGFVSCLEMEAVLIEALPFTGEAPIVEVVERLIDIDENGVIDRDEFIHWLEHATANKRAKDWERALSKAHGLSEWYGIRLPANLEDTLKSVTILDAIVEIAREKGANLDYTPSEKLIRSSKVHRFLKKHEEYLNKTKGGEAAETRRTGAEEGDESGVEDATDEFEVDGLLFGSSHSQKDKQEREEHSQDASRVHGEGSERSADGEGEGEKAHPSGRSHIGGRWRRERDAMGPGHRHLYDFDHIQKIKEEIERRKAEGKTEEEVTKEKEQEEKIKKIYRQGVEGVVDEEVEPFAIPDEPLRKYIYNEEVHDFEIKEEEPDYVALGKVREYLQEKGEDAMKPKTEGWKEASVEHGLHIHPVLGHIHYDLAEKGLRDIFTLMDFNGDGYIVPLELRVAINKSDIKKAKERAREWEEEAGFHSKEEEAKAQAEKEKREKMRERMKKEREKRKILRQEKRERMKRRMEESDGRKAAERARMAAEKIRNREL